METVQKAIRFTAVLIISAYCEGIPLLNVAVNDLSANGIDASAALIISDRLRSELIATGAFRVMERNEMRTILKEQGFQQTGACDESSCLVEVGQLLGVQRMIAGSVGQIGTLYTVSLRMINVETSQVLYTANEDHEGDIKGLLGAAIGRVARSMAAGAGGEIARAVLAGKTADIHITSMPTGASVEIDGNTIAGATPLTLQGVSAGTHRIIARKGSYYGTKMVDLAPDDLVKVTITLEKGTGVLKVFSTPDSAKVNIDGHYQGITPCKIDPVFAGEHDMVVEKTGYQIYKQKFVLKIEETLSVSVELRPAVYLTVNVIGHPDAAIAINDKWCESGSVKNRELPPGEVVIKVDKTGYQSVEETRTFAPGKYTVDVKLQSMYASFAVFSEPQGAAVAVNDSVVGQTPYTSPEILPGSYIVRLQKYGYEPWADTIIAALNTRDTVSVLLSSVFGTLRVGSEPTGAEVYLDDTLRGITPYVNDTVRDGNFRLKINMAGFESVVDSFTMARNATVDRDFALNHTAEFIDSVKCAATLSYKNRQRVRRVVFGVATGTSIALSGYFHSNVAAAIRDQQELQDQYSAATTNFELYKVQYNTRRQDADKARLRRNIFAGLAGTFAAGLVVSIPF